MNTSLKQLNFGSHHKVKMIILVRICTSVHKCNYSRLIETIAIVRLKFKQNCGELPISFAETKPHPLANTLFECVENLLARLEKTFFNQYVVGRDVTAFLCAVYDISSPFFLSMTSDCYFSKISLKFTCRYSNCLRFQLF